MYPVVADLTKDSFLVTLDGFCANTTGEFVDNLRAGVAAYIVTFSQKGEVQVRRPFLQGTPLLKRLD